MKLPVVWMPEADADVKEAQAWYDAVRPALGEQFCAGSQRGSGGDRRKSAAFPGHLPTPAACASLTFPYGIIFEFQEHQIVVIACFHGRRNPTRWQLR